ncbi:MAG TPA: hypothetical protein VGC85_07145, partial [Chthoniobacterales bacterium]
MSYLELLKFAAPEAIVTATVLIVLTVGLTSRHARGVVSIIALAGLIVAAFAILRLPRIATLPAGMLVITPLNSLFEVIALALSFFTILLARRDPATRENGSEFVAMILLGTIGLLLLVGSEELLMIF